ncbi:VWA domain-containing protein [Marinomonas algarum]|uniref:VWA domain-containing protein n=1 Tax=Marinomonas algarum TaxID=2883105 RepID=A0A9X1INQ1_9GAMM|nr:VWA domain-containing protein [Marinomonas algarum]MCB5162199.1 VWA domain-containing protein [Marinomonas algarum]
MKRLKMKIVLLLAVLFSVWAPFSMADTQFRVIVDASGSMQTSDPDKLTSEAINLLSELAPEQTTTLGVWLFGEAPRVLLPESVVTADTRATLSRSINNYVTQDVKTDLEAILRLLLKTPDSESLSLEVDRHWILVTDGFVDISLDDNVNKASRQRILQELTDELKLRDIHLHTLSMTSYTDKALLKAMSLRTDATHTEVALPIELLDTLSLIASQVIPNDELPLDNNRFWVDDAVTSMTLMALHDVGIEPEWITPTGQQLALQESDKIKVARSEYFTLVTISDPEQGDWQVQNVDLNRTRITVSSSLGIRSAPVAEVVFENLPIDTSVSLLRNNQPVTEASQLSGVQVTQSLIRLNGERKDVVYNGVLDQVAGRFENTLEGIHTTGTYQLVTGISGKGFFRQSSQFFTVAPAIELSGKQSGDDFVVFSAQPTSDTLDLLRSEIHLHLTYNNGTKSTEVMPLTLQGHWEKIIPVTSGENVQVEAVLTGQTVSDKEKIFEYRAPKWRYQRQGAGLPQVYLDGNEQKMPAPSSALSVDNDVNPVQISPSFTLVSEEEAQSVESEKIADPSLSVKKAPLNAESTPSSHSIGYKVAGAFGVLVLLTVVFFVFRRRKQ